MADKKPEKDVRKVDQPKADNLFSNPNDLEELLKDLDSYEDWTSTDNLFQSEKGDRLVVEPHEPYEGAEKAKKVSASEKLPQSIKKDVKNLDEKTLQEILEDYTAYEKYLGIADAELPKYKDELVNTKEFPMDTESKIK